MLAFAFSSPRFSIRGALPLALRRRAAGAVVAMTAVLLAACGGGDADPPPPPESGGGVAAVAPSITQQPQSTSVTAGSAASFSVAASGTAPLDYQWQRNGANIAGATATTYSIATTALGDSGATFRALVSNSAGNATSSSATLTVTASAPVLTITQQPAATSVAAGAPASFAVAGTCSSGTPGIQWQRAPAAPSTAFVDIAGATATNYTLASTMPSDNGAQFRARLDCAGQSPTTSSVATLTVPAPTTVTMTELPITGLRAQAELAALRNLDALPDGSTALISGNQIKRIAADLSAITRLTGSGSTGAADGPAATASFSDPAGLTHDAAGNLYVADTMNHLIRRVAVDGTVSTLAGAAGMTGSADGTGSAARFDRPYAIALGPDGDLYVADRNNHRIRRVSLAGVVTTYAGSTAGYADGAALVAQFREPLGIAIAANGDVLVADTLNSRIRRIVRNGAAAGAVETLAGDGSAAVPGADGVGTAAGISQPTALVVRGNDLFARDGAALIRRIDLTTGAVTTFTGSRSLGSGFADGAPGEARLRDVGRGVTTAPGGGLLVSDDAGLRAVDAAGNVRTFAIPNAFNNTPEDTGVLAQVQFVLNATALAVDGAGNVVVNEARTVRRIAPGGSVSLVAGLRNGLHAPLDGIGSAAQIQDSGNSLAAAPGGVLFFGDRFGVRRIGTDNAVSVLAGSMTASGAADGPGATARFTFVNGLAVGPNGDVFAADTANHAIRRIDTAGNVTTYAGRFNATTRVDGPIGTASLASPTRLAFAPDGALYFIDGGALRRVSADGMQVSTTPVGSSAFALAVDADGSVYVGAASGLSVLRPGAPAATLLVPRTGTLLLGNAPQLDNLGDIALLGPKQIVVNSGTKLVLVTVP